MGLMVRLRHVTHGAHGEITCDTRAHGEITTCDIWGSWWAYMWHMGLMVRLRHVTPCSLVKVYQHFGRWIGFNLRLNELHLSNLIMRTTKSPKMWANFYQASRCHFPKTKAPPPTTWPRTWCHPNWLQHRQSVPAVTTHIQATAGHTLLHIPARPTVTKHNQARFKYSCL